MFGDFGLEHGGAAQKKRRNNGMQNIKAMWGQVVVPSWRNADWLRHSVSFSPAGWPEVLPTCWKPLWYVHHSWRLHIARLTTVVQPEIGYHDDSKLATNSDSQTDQLWTWRFQRFIGHRLLFPTEWAVSQSNFGILWDFGKSLEPTWLGPASKEVQLECGPWWHGDFSNEMGDFPAKPCWSKILKHAGVVGVSWAANVWHTPYFHPCLVKSKIFN